MKTLSQYITERFISGSDLSKLASNKNVLKYIVDVYSRVSGIVFYVKSFDDLIENAEINETEKQIIISGKPIKVRCNITSGLLKAIPMLKGYKIKLPDGSGLEIADSQSKSRPIAEFKDAIFNVFSKDTKYYGIFLKYIKRGDSTVADFLNDVWCNDLYFASSSGFKRDLSNSSQFANSQCNIEFVKDWKYESNCKENLCDPDLI